LNFLITPKNLGRPKPYKNTSPRIKINIYPSDYRFPVYGFRAMEGLCDAEVFCVEKKHLPPIFL